MLKLIETLTNAGIPVPAKDTETFKIVRWGRNNRYWLKKFEGGYVFGDFVNGINSHIFEQNFKGKSLEKAQYKLAEALKFVQPSIDTVNALAANKAATIWTKSEICSDHAYTKNKKIRNFGLKIYKNCLVVPIFDSLDKLWSLQFIDNDGNKRFLSGGKKKGCYFTIGSLENAEKAFICEGYATGATIHECTEIPVIVAFDAGNLKSVAQVIHNKYSNLSLIFCADNDCYHESGINPGVEKAKEAAEFVGATVIIPQFKDKSTHPTDFNDLMILEGRDAVKTFLEQALQNSNCNRYLDIPEGFALSDDGLFCIDKKSKELKRINSNLKLHQGYGIHQKQ